MFRLAGERFDVMPDVAGENRVSGLAEFPADPGLFVKIAPHGLHFGDQLRVGEGWFEIDGDGGSGHRAEDRAELIDRAALDAVAGD